MGFMSKIAPEDPLTYGGLRSEIDYAPEANAERCRPSGKFISKRLFAPSTRFTFMQIHDSPDGGESPVKYPNFEFQTHGMVSLRGAAADCPNETTPGRYPQ